MKAYSGVAWGPPKVGPELLNFFARKREKNFDQNFGIFVNTMHKNDVTNESVHLFLHFGYNSAVYLLYINLKWQ